MSTTSPLLPTPRFEGFDAGNHRGKPDGLNQTIRQLPTPTAGDGASSGNRNLPGSKAHPGTSLTDVVREDRTSSARGFLASQPAPPAGGEEPTTIAGSGRRLPVSLANWDPELSSWRTSQVSLLSTEDERFPRSWERWPTSGMTRHGQAFALPTLERPTVGSGSSSSLNLPTPSVIETGGYATNPRKDANFETNHAVSTGQVIAHLATPTTGDTHPSYDKRISPGQKPRARPVPNLAAQVDELLPTPRVPTGGPEPTAMRRARGNIHGTTLEASLGELMDPPSSGGSE